MCQAKGELALLSTSLLIGSAPMLDAGTGLSTRTRWALADPEPEQKM